MMLSNRTAIWLFACVAVALTTRGALAQIPADSGADYPGPGQSYEEGGAPFAASDNSKTHGLWPVSPGHVGSYAPERSARSALSGSLGERSSTRPRRRPAAR